MTLPERSVTRWCLTLEQRRVVSLGVARYDTGRIALQLALESPDVDCDFLSGDDLYAQTWLNDSVVSAGA